MATRDKARLAKQELARTLGGADWLRGIGLGGDGLNYAVRVNVSHLTPQIAEKIPRRVLDVDVIVDDVGETIPHRGPGQE